MTNVQTVDVSTKHYGVIIGRFQPPHIGHQSLVGKVTAKGLIPIVVLGSAQESQTTKNPYNVHQRANMLRLVYPDLHITAVDDYSNWDNWFIKLIFNIRGMISVNDTFSIITHNKEEDRCNFTFRGTAYKDCFYTEVFTQSGIPTIPLTLSEIPVRATQIRNSIEEFKEYLDPRVYSYIKDLSES